MALSKPDPLIILNLLDNFFDIINIKDRLMPHHLTPPPLTLCDVATTAPLRKNSLWSYGRVAGRFPTTHSCRGKPAGLRSLIFACLKQWPAQHQA